MVDFLTLLKGTGRKFQLQAEVVVLEHDATNRQKAFGIELYDLIEAQRVKMRAQIEITIEESKPKGAPEQAGGLTADDVETAMKIFQTIENEIKDPLEACRSEIAKLEEIPAPVKQLLIKKKKEDFGVAIWPIVSEPKWLHETLGEDLKAVLANNSSTNNINARDTPGSNITDTPGSNITDTSIGNLMFTALKGVVKGTKTTITKAIGKISPEEREVEACVTTAKREMSVYEDRKMEKLSEIEALVAAGTTLECC